MANTRSYTDRASSLTVDDKEIQSKVDFELNEMQLKMTKIGGITNIFGALIVFWIQYDQASFIQLATWYAILFLFNVINIGFSFYFQYSKVTPDKIAIWLKVYHYLIVPPVCITWGMMGVIFTGSDLHHQFYTIVLLLAVLVSFSFGTITDFKASVISICGLLAPTLIYRIYAGISAVVATGSDANFNLGTSVCLFILGIFLTITCYIGYRLIKKSFVLSYINISLNEELENANIFLEQRVKERTIELENSLKLVTYQATHDLLTDLPNQRLLIEYMEATMKLANKENHSVGVICFVINEIEKINDALGHKSGEHVIKIVAERLQKFAKKLVGDLSDHTQFTITLSRKDVFVILLNPVYQIENIDLYAEQLFFILDKPIHTNKQILKLTASMGISFYPRDGKDINTLLMNSDAAMLRAKQRGGNSLAIYNTELNADISRQLEMEQHLHTALGREEFNVQYQPFVDLKTGQICGAEVLVRWENPSLGPISPVHFIPLAEANGIIVPLGDWVLRTACRQTKIWHEMGFSSFRIAVNLSAKQLQQKDVIHIIEEILHQSGLKPEYLELELTESTAFQEDTIPLLKKMKAMGVSLSIDDFGTGYSSLSNLKSFSIDKLKIDQSFVKDVSTNNDSRTIVSNTIAMAKKLNIKVLAEGVETKEQLMFLREHDCDMIQGYYFSRPIDGEAFTQLLESRAQFVVS